MKAKNYIGYFLGRLLVLLLFVWLLNFLYTKFLWEDDLRTYDAHLLLELMDKQDSSDVIYFGESSNFSIHPDDTQRLSISQLIDLQLPWKVSAINKGAYHAGIYYPLIQRLDQKQLKAIVVTLNLRTLNQATIHAPLETALQKEARMYANRPPLLNRILLTLNNYDNASLEDRDKAMWRAWTYDTLRSDQYSFPAPTIKSWCELPKFVDSSGKEDMEKRTLADHYIKAYAFQIDPESNPRIEQLDQIVELCKEKGLSLVFNLLAENTEYADSLVGENLVWLMRSNRDLLVNRYGADALVVDNLEVVAGKHYTDQHWTTEHYNQIGRQLIADRVAQALASIAE